MEIERTFLITRDNADALLQKYTDHNKTYINQHYLFSANSRLTANIKDKCWLVEVIHKTHVSVVTLPMSAEMHGASVESQIEALKAIGATVGGIAQLEQRSDCAARFRVLDGNTVVFTYKQKTSSLLSTIEFEFAVDMSDLVLDNGLNWIDCDTFAVQKTRYTITTGIVMAGGTEPKLELDLFHNQNFGPYLECEFKCESDAAEFDFSVYGVSEEITGSPELSNKSLSVRNHIESVGKSNR